MLRVTIIVNRASEREIIPYTGEVDLTHSTDEHVVAEILGASAAMFNH